VKVLILLAIRESDQATAHMKILATLARRLMHDEFRERLEQEGDAEALCRFLADEVGTL
jgi:fructose-specific PTS system IIA-like component